MLSLFKSIYSIQTGKNLLRNKVVLAAFSRLNFSEDGKNSKEKKNNPTVPAIRSPFEEAAVKTKENYLDMITVFEGRDVHRRNHVEFIYAALKNMQDYGLHCDLEVYKALINVMPKGKFIPTNVFQAEFMHYPKQQQCIIDLLEQMEDNGVIPDAEMEQMLLNVFGRKGHPLRKYWRMMYWMPKFKNLSPWPLPNPVAHDILELAKLAVARMCSVDLLSKVSVYDTEEISDSIDKTWIVSGISAEQSELLTRHDKSQSIFVEGPQNIWLRNKMINYFVLRGDPTISSSGTEEEDTDDVSNLRVPFFNHPPVRESRIAHKRSVHEQDDGTIFAVCVTGTSSQDSLLSWIRLLEKYESPRLSEIPILFKFKSSKGNEIIPMNSNRT